MGERCKILVACMVAEGSEIFAARAVGYPWLYCLETGRATHTDELGNQLFRFRSFWHEEWSVGCRWEVVVGQALKIREGWSGASRKRGAVAKWTNQMISRPHLKPPHHSADFVARRSCAGGHIRRYVSHTLSYVSYEGMQVSGSGYADCAAGLDDYCTAGRFMIDSWQRLLAAAWPRMDDRYSGTRRRRDS